MQALCLSGRALSTAETHTAHWNDKLGVCKSLTALPVTNAPVHCCLVAQWCPTLCNPVDCSLPGSSVHGILQARILKWVAFSLCRGSSQPRMEPGSPALAGRFFTTEQPRKPCTCTQRINTPAPTPVPPESPWDCSCRFSQHHHDTNPLPSP